MKARTYLNLSAVLILLVSFVTIKGDLFAQQQQVEGFGTEVVVKDYPYLGLAFLQNFYFKFSSGDRDIQVILVEPGEPSNKITLGYFDNTRNDEYFYKIAHQTRNLFGIHFRSLVFLNNGKETLDGLKPGPDFTFVLIGFQFSYRADPHHIDEIGVLEDDGRVTVFLNDKNDDDPFLVKIQYAWLPNSLIQNTGVETGTRVSGGDKRPIPDGIPVIRGFKFDFEPYFTRGKDHHLREIGVLTTSTTSGDLEVYYSDKNRDDGFDWEVRWAILSEPFFPFQIVVEVNDAFIKALTGNDPSLVDSLIDDNFIFIDCDGAVINKTQWIDNIKGGEFTYKFDDTNDDVRVFGNTAVVTGRAEMTRKVKEQKFSRKFQFTRVYLFDGGHWRVIAISISSFG